LKLSWNSETTPLQNQKILYESLGFMAWLWLLRSKTRPKPPPGQTIWVSLAWLLAWGQAMHTTRNEEEMYFAIVRKYEVQCRRPSLQKNHHVSSFIWKLPSIQENQILLLVEGAETT